MTCQEVDDRLVSFLYGELPEDARAAVRAHADGCARCRANLEGFEDVRAAVRSVLDEPPPARVRSAIGAAATAAVASARTEDAVAAGAAVAVRAAAAEPERSRMPRSTTSPSAAAPVGSSLSSWLERLRSSLRGRWTFPTFATVGAIALLLLGRRVLLDPDRAYDRRPERWSRPATEVREVPRARSEEAAPPAAAMADEATESSEKSAVPLPSPADAPARPARSSRPAGPAARDPMPPPGAGVPGRGEPQVHRRAERTFAPPPPAWRREARPSSAPGAGPGAPPAAAAKVPSVERRSASPPPEAADRAWDRPQPAAAPSASAMARKPANSEVAPEVVLKAPEHESNTPGGPDSSEASGAAAKSGAAPSLDSLVRRADRHFGEERWMEAAVAYRELLARAPEHADAGRWRQRLAFAKAQAANERAGGAVP